MKNFLTFAMLDSQCLKQAGNLTDNDIYPQTRMNYINTSLMKIYFILDNANDPFYNRSAVLTIGNDIETLSGQNNNATIGLNTTNNTVYRSSGTFTAGSLIVITSVDNDVPRHNFVARITSNGQTASYTRISGTNLNRHTTEILSFTIIKSLSQYSYDLSQLYVKSINTIYDDRLYSTPGTIRVFDKITDPVLYFNRSLDYNAKNRVAWYHQGDTVQFFVGSEANSLGIVTMEYRAKPALFTDATKNNEIDIPPEANQMLIDEVTTLYMNEVKRPVPEEIVKRMSMYEQWVAAYNETSKRNMMARQNRQVVQ